MNCLKNKHYLGIWFRQIAEHMLILDWKTALARFPPKIGFIPFMNKKPWKY
jgi:hypothetical protein